MATTLDDIVAVGGDLEPETLIRAYESGVFPWPMADMGAMPWFCPHERAVLDFKDLHVSRSLEKVRKKAPFRLSVDEAFDDVIEQCAETPRPGQDGTWITEEMTDAYKKLHRLGHAHSVEAWEGRTLVGGIYGVASKNYFSAESMFYFKPYASKLALLYLIDHLRARGLEWLDIQVMTDHMEKMGAKILTRRQFLKRLADEPARELFTKPAQGS